MRATIKTMSIDAEATITGMDIFPPMVCLELTSLVVSTPAKSVPVEDNNKKS